MPAEHAAAMRNLAEFYQNLLSFVPGENFDDKFLDLLIHHLGKSRDDVIKFVREYRDEYTGGILYMLYNALAANVDICAYINCGMAYCNDICRTIFVTIEDDLNYCSHWARLWLDRSRMISPNVYKFTGVYQIKISVFPTGILIAVSKGRRDQ